MATVAAPSHETTKKILSANPLNLVALEVTTDTPQTPTLQIVSPTPGVFTFPTTYNLADTNTKRRKLSSSSDVVERRTKKGKEDYIKCSDNAFILFRRKCYEGRQQLQEESAAASEGPAKKQGMADLSKTIRQQWKNLSVKERQIWEELAKDKKKEHENLYPNYVYRPQRAVDKDGGTKSIEYVPKSNKFDGLDSVSFIVPVAHPQDRSASAPTPPPHQSIQVPDVYYMTPSRPTSPSLLPIISRQDAASGYQEEGPSAFVNPSYDRDEAPPSAATSSDSFSPGAFGYASLGASYSLKSNMVESETSPENMNSYVPASPFSRPLPFVHSLTTAADPVDLSAFVIRDSNYPVHGGSYADVYSGVLSQDEKTSKVAIKIIRAHIYTEANQHKISKRLKREIRLWSCLQHPNIVPLLGITQAFGPHTGMVCPWMSEGNLNHYLKDQNPYLTLRTRLQILSDVVEGLVYLHTLSIVHGDLTTGNILMEDGKALLSDFGLSGIKTQNSSLLTSTVGGAVRWAAPELYPFYTDTSVIPELTKPCDVYSFGSVALETISGKIPYHNIASDIQVLLELMKGNCPARPVEKLLTDAAWELITLCWTRDPHQRPSIEEVRRLLQIHATVR